MRAGLLLAGDVAPTRAAILAEASSEEIPAQTIIGELYEFATSDVYSDLRGAIGVAINS